MPLGRRLPDDRLVDGTALLFVSNLLVFELFAQGKQCRDDILQIKASLESICELTLLQVAEVQLSNVVDFRRLWVVVHLAVLVRRFVVSID